MTVTVDSFREEYPEFMETSRNLCSKRLAFATGRIAPQVWGDKTDTGIMLLTAHLLSISPSGENARLKATETTVYGDEFTMMKREVTAGVGRVT